MAIGDTAIGRAMQTNIQLDEASAGAMEARRGSRVREALATESLAEQKRSNLIREGVAERGLEQRERSLSQGEKSLELQEQQLGANIEATKAKTAIAQDQLQFQKDEMYLQQQPKWDEIAGTYYGAVGDFDEQQSELLKNRKTLTKELKQLGYDDAQLASFVSMQEIDLELKRLEESRTAFIEGFEDNPGAMRALMLSSTGYEQGILGQASPYTISQMSEEQAATYQNTTKEQFEQYKKQRDEQSEYEAGLQARMLERSSKAKAKGTAEGTLPSEISLLEKEYELRGEELQTTTGAKNQIAIDKAVV
jgi:hypothetical protein